MPLVAALVALALAAPSAGPPAPWREPAQSLGHLTGFTVRADAHGTEADRAIVSLEDVERQMAAALRACTITVFRPAPGTRARVHGGALILDVHVLSVPGGTAIAWTLNASQNVQLLSESWAFASTWQVGDLLHAPPGAGRERLSESLKPALDDLCKAYRASRPPPPAPPATEVPGSPL